MHYVPQGVKDIDKKVADDSILEPATKIWDVLQSNPGSHTEGQIVDLFIQSTERKNKTKKIEDLVKKAVSELQKDGFVYEFSGQYYIVLNKV